MPDSMDSKLYKKLLDEADMNILVCDTNTYRLFFANKGVIEFSGRTEDYKGFTCYEYLMHRDTPCEDCNVCKLDSYNMLADDAPRRGKYYSRKGKRIDWDGKDAYVEYVEDITAEKQQREHERLKEELNQERNANKAKSEFLSRMSHDIRTPMNAIIGLTALSLDEKNLSGIIKDNLTKISEAGRFLMGLVNDILDMSRIEEGKIEFHNAPYKYSDFLSNMKTMFVPQCEAKDIEVTFEDIDEDVSVLTDKIRLNQIFFNIMSNAVKYTPDGGRISFYTHIYRSDDEFIEGDYTIEDNGIGMSEEFQKNMFEPFTQGNSNITTNIQGSGLGLSIAKNLVELMNGNIKIESNLEKGTKVTVHLINKICHCSDKNTACKEFPISKDDFCCKSALIVEDHPINAQIACRILEKRNINVVLATNGLEAVEKFSSSPEGFFNIVFMDIRMPVMDGLTSAKKIRKLNRSDSLTVPIIAMTANAFDDDEKKAKKAGMTGFISKPINIDDIHCILNENLK